MPLGRTFKRDNKNFIGLFPQALLAMRQNQQSALVAYRHATEP